MDDVLDGLNHPILFLVAITLIAIAGPIAFAAAARAVGLNTLAEVARPGAGK